MPALSLMNATLNATMRGVVYSGIPFNMTVEDLALPVTQNQTDAIVRITTSALCGSDLHVYRGVNGGTPPFAMGHEAVGYVSEIGSAVSSLTVGEYVIIPDAAGHGHFQTEPTTLDFFGNGAALSDGLQCESRMPPFQYRTTRTNEMIKAEYARVPFADGNLIPIPLDHNTTNRTIEQDYLTVSDIFGTAWTGLNFAGFEAGDTVAVFGAGPVGLLAAYSAMIRGASNIYIIDHVTQRLDRAASMGFIPINFTAADPVEQILAFEPDGVMRSLDCVGMEPVNANLELQEDIVVGNMIAVTHQNGGMGQIGAWGVQSSSDGAPLGDSLSSNITFPIADFFSKALRYQSGAVDPKLVANELVELIATGKASPGQFIATADISIEEAPEYYMRFNRSEEIKVYIHFP